VTLHGVDWATCWDAVIVAGKAVYCEAPLGRTVSDTEDMATAGRSHHTAVGLQGRLNPAVRRAAQLLSSGKIGRPRNARVASTTVGFGPELPFSHDYFNKASSGANLLTINAGHTLDLVEAGRGEEQQYVVLGKRISGEWWQALRSPQLDEALDLAVAGNGTLAAAQASLSQAREAAAAATGALYPQLDLSAGATRQRINFAAEGISGFPPKIFNLYTLGPSLSYAFDLWGETRRSVEKQQALAQQAGCQVAAAYVTLTGNVVTQVIQMASLRKQMDATEMIIRDDEHNFELVRIQFRGGEANQSDVQFAASQLANDPTQLPPLQQQLDIARHALAVLVGKAPAEWSPPDFDLDAFMLPHEVPVSLPSALVRQRPAVRAAEADLHAASAAIGVATAQLYPSITLSASLTQEALNPGHPFSGGASAWSLGARLTQPLFHGGALEAQRRAAVDAYQGTFATYQQTVLQAFGQVADVLKALQHDAELLRDQRLARNSAAESLRLERIA
jgi:NodT family efflux transporter outer membrane factor (OMF) lipoprotein